MNRMPRASGTFAPPARAWKNIVSLRPSCFAIAARVDAAGAYCRYLW